VLLLLLNTDLQVYRTSDPPRPRTGAMLILKCFSPSILCMLYKSNPPTCITLSIKNHMKIRLVVL
jgi:hypothetical protein